MKNIILLIILAFSLFSCAEPKNETAIVEVETTDNLVVLTPAQLDQVAISTATLQETALPSILQLNGKIEVPPQNVFTISSPLGGYLKSTTMLPGMKIKKGQLLGIVEDEQFIQLQEDFLLAKANLQYAEQDYQRQKTLNAANASSDKITQQALLEVNNLKIRIAALTEKLSLIGINTSALNSGNISKRIKIISPINGFVSQVNANAGRYLSPYDVVFELIDPSVLQLKVNVFEKDLKYVAVGKTITAYPIVDPEEKYKLKITMINNQIGNTGNSEVYCKIDSRNPELVAGSYMNAEVEVNNKVARTLPEESVVHFEGKDYVFVAVSATDFLMTEVTAGETRNGVTELLESDVLVSKSIVTKGAYTLLMKLKNVEE